MKVLYFSVPFFPILLHIWPVRGSLNIDENAENSYFQFEENTETTHQSTGEISESYWESHAEGVDEPYVKNDAEESLQEFEIANARQPRSRERMKAAALATIIGFLVVSLIYAMHVRKIKAKKEYLNQQFELFKKKFEESQQASQQFHERYYFYNKLDFLYDKKIQFLEFEQLYDQLSNQSLKLEQLFDNLNEKKNLFEDDQLKYDELLDDLNNLEEEFDNFNNLVRLLLKT